MNDLKGEFRHDAGYVNPTAKDENRPLQGGARPAEVTWDSVAGWVGVMEMND